MSDKIDQVDGALGFAIANFAVSTNILTLLVRKGLVTKAEAFDAISRARRVVEGAGGFPDCPGSMPAAQQCLKLVEQVFLADTAESTRSQAN